MIRMTQPGNPPGESEIAEWIGTIAWRYWQKVTQLISETYPNVFEPEWLFGGKKHGWSLRYKKVKSFCTLIPEKNRFALLIVFGREERAKVETIRESLSRVACEAYDSATTYHDGKWVLLTIDSDQMIDDVMRLLEIKRKRRKHPSEH